MADKEDILYELVTEPALPDEAIVLRWKGRESLSTLYHYEVEITTGEASVGLRDFIGARAKLVIRTNAHTRYVSGVITKAQMLAGGASSGDEAAMHTVFQFAPALTLLQHRRGHRIFQEMTTEEIVSKVVEDAGIYAGRALTWRHEQTLEKRDYCVQYRESDYAFISRLLEDEGLFFYFAQSEDGDALVITDGKDVEDIEGEADITFMEGSGLTPIEHISSFNLETEIASNQFSHRDFDYEHPLLELEGMSKYDGSAPADALSLETYEYPGRFTDPNDGTRRAENFLGALVRNAVVARGDAAVTRFLPGLSFAMTGHGRSDLNGRYIMRSIEHGGAAAMFDSSIGDARNYHCSFSCTPEGLAVRPQRITPKPRMYGAQTATVVGPSGVEVHVDDQSRIKVQFHWDREGKADENSSCWVRVAQTWAGAGWGALTVPRVGMEVVVSFLEGDPDKPLVTGCVYNATHPPPLDSHTKSVFRTSSSPGGGGSNELSFEDKKGEEKIYMHAQRDLVQVVERNIVTIVGGTRKTIVKGDSLGGGESSAVGHRSDELSSAAGGLRSSSSNTLVNVLTEEEENKLQDLNDDIADFERDQADGKTTMDTTALEKLKQERDALEQKKNAPPEPVGPPAPPPNDTGAGGAPGAGAGGAPPTAPGNTPPTPADTQKPREDLVKAKAGFEKKKEEFQKNLPKPVEGPPNDPAGDAAKGAVEARKGPEIDNACVAFGEELTSPQGVLVDGSSAKVSVLCGDSYVTMVPGTIDIGTGGTVTITAPNIILNGSVINIKGGATKVTGATFLAECGTNAFKGTNIHTGASTMIDVPTLIDNTLMVSGTTDIGSKTTVFADIKGEAEAKIATKLTVPKIEGTLELNC